MIHLLPHIRRSSPTAAAAGRAALVLAALLPAVAARADRDRSTTVNLAQAMKKTVLVFPFDVPTTMQNGPDVQQLLSEVVESRLQVSNQYNVVEFNQNLPPVARLHMEQELTDSDVAAPFADSTAKALKITKAVGYDSAFIGAVDDYSYNDTDNSVTMVVRGELVDAKTGKSIGAPVTLSASSSKGGTAKEPQKALEAARTGASQLAQQLVPITGGGAQPVAPVNPNTQPTRAPKKHHDSTGLMLGLLAIALGIGIGVASSGGGHGGANNGVPPPPP